MEVYKNNICATSDEQGDTSCGSLTYSENDSCKYQNEHKYISNNNNNFKMRRNDHITVADTQPRREHSTYLFWTLVVLLFVLALGNLVLTFIILGVLRLGQGMESLELVKEERLIKFFGNTDLDNIYKRDGKLESFNQSPMEILGDLGNVTIGLSKTEIENSPEINFASKAGEIKNVESFDVRNPYSGKSIFSTDFPNFGLPKGVEKLDVKVGLTKRISSAVDESLLIKSDSYVKLKGSEGLHLDGKEIIWSADQDLFLKSVNKSIILNGNNGVFIDAKNIKVASHGNEIRSYTQYKICVCMPEGKLFRLPILPGQSTLISCDNVDMSVNQNPCL